MIALLALATLLQTQEPAPARPVDERICRSEAGRGSRLPVQVCLTEEQWLERIEAAGLRRSHYRPTIDSRRPFPGPGRRS